MSTPAAKRRRIETASRTLCKPFRSPFKSPGADTVSKSLISNKDISTTSSNPTNNPSKFTTTTTPKPAQRFSQTPKSTPTSTLNRPQSTSTTSTTDPQLATLLKSQRALERSITTLRNEMDTLKQAQKIETSGSDDELRVLMERWRKASREVAEELYKDVRERVNRMGGPAAWKDMQRKRNEWGRSSGFDEPPAGHGETSGDEEERKKRDMYAEYDVDDDEPVNEKATEGSDDDEGFTMDMMLKSLNIELEVIGFDRKLQRWAD